MLFGIHASKKFKLLSIRSSISARFLVVFFVRHNHVNLFLVKLACIYDEFETRKICMEGMLKIFFKTNNYTTR